MAMGVLPIMSNTEPQMGAVTQLQGIVFSLKAEHLGPRKTFPGGLPPFLTGVI